MRAIAASVGLFVGAFCWLEPALATDAPPPAPVVALNAILQVCREAAINNLAPAVLAEKLGYAPEAVPEGLPMVSGGAKSWLVPSSNGSVHVLSGAIPEPAQVSACFVAIYGDPMIGFEDVLTARITQPDIGFERDAKQSFTTDRFKITHYDSSQGYLVRNVMAVRPLVTTPDHPTLSVISYRVDYSWLKSISH